MYKLVDVFNQTGVDIINDRSFFHTYQDGGVYYFREVNIYGNEIRDLSYLNLTTSSQVYGCMDYLVVAYDDVTVFYDLDQFISKFIIEDVLFVFTEDDSYLHVASDKSIYRIDKYRLLISIYPRAGGEDYFSLLVDGFMVSTNLKEKSVSVSAITPTGYEELWRRPLLDYFPNFDDDLLGVSRFELYKVYAYLDSFIAVTYAGIIRLCVTDGSVVWQTFIGANTLEIVGDVGYFYSSGKIFRLSLSDGSVWDYGRGNEEWPMVSYPGIFEHEFWPGDLAYHQGKLWCTIGDWRGNQGVIEIDVETGAYGKDVIVIPPERGITGLCFMQDNLVVPMNIELRLYTPVAE